MKFIIVCFFSLLPPLIKSQSLNHEVDSLWAVAENPALHDTTIANAYILLSEKYYDVHRDSVFVLGEKALQFIEKALSENSSEKVEKSLLTSKSTALNNIGLAHLTNGDIPQTLDYLHESLKTDEILGNKEGAANSLNNLGYVYLQYEDYDQALDYFNQAIPLRIETHDSSGLSMTLNNIGMVYYYLDDSINTIKYFQESLSIQLEVNKDDYNGLSADYGNMAAVYRNFNDYDNSIKNYETAIDYAYLSEDDEQIALLTRNLGITYLDIDNVEKAEYYGNISMEIAQEIGFYESIKDAADLLGRVYEKQNKGMKALEMHKLYVAMDDSLNKEHTQEALIEQKIQYSFEKKEALQEAEHDKQLALQEADHEKELAVQEETEKRNQIVIWSISIILVLISVFVFVIIHRLRESNRQKKIIQEKNEENEVLLSEIHHRVKNNLQVVSSLLSLQERSIEDPSIKEAIIHGKERVRSMGLIHKLLYQHNNFAGVDMDDYVKTLTSGLMDSFGKNQDDFDLEVNISDLKLDIDTAVPLGLIINELIVNALKYAYSTDERGRLKITMIEKDNELQLDVQDNGNGTIEQIENSSSFGMKLIKSLLRQISGKMKIEDNNGLHFMIEVKDYKLLSYEN